jgi:antitoxin VapB
MLDTLKIHTDIPDLIYIFKGLVMKTAKLFQNGQSQAVRLPKEFRFEGNKVIINRSGNTVVLIPANHSWEVLATSLDKFISDFMDNHNQPEQQSREDLFV